MALSNMAVEPRREWTEQGLGVIGLVLYVVFSLVLALHLRTWNGHDNSDVAQVILSTFATGIGLVISLALLVMLSTGIWYLIHEVGEMVCELLALVGLDPRPKKRFAKDWNGKIVRSN